MTNAQPDQRSLKRNSLLRSAFPPGWKPPQVTTKPKVAATSAKLAAPAKSSAKKEYRPAVSLPVRAQAIKQPTAEEQRAAKAAERAAIAARWDETHAKNNPSKKPLFALRGVLR